MYSREYITVMEQYEQQLLENYYKEKREADEE
jgi:hypothetical protein